MPTSKQKLASSLPNKGIAIALISIALIGFSDASYLTIEHLRGAEPACGLIEGCGEVTSSEYATIMGIPVALGGALYYLSILLLSIAYLDVKKETILRVVAYLSPIGFLASLYFVYLQLFVIHAICIYCMGSAISSTLIFVLGMWLLKKLHAIDIS